MDTTLQQRIIPLFHYALNSGGYLVLGTSETVGDGLFKTIDKKSKIYKKRDGINPIPVNLSVASVHNESGKPREEQKTGKRSVRELTEGILLKDFAPDCIVTNENGEILNIHGSAGKYLEIGPGDMNVNILRTLRQGLRIDLANAMHRIRATKGEIRFEGLRIKLHDTTELVDVTVKRFTLAADIPLVMIVFHSRPADGKGKKPKAFTRALHVEQVAALERELRSKEEFLQATVEELEAANEELKSTNEELQSTNEELQSTNEELETSKEELQSVNEELSTVNAELEQKIEELSRANTDMNSLLAGTGIGTVFIDPALRIQRFTPAATRIINLIPSDIGRPLAHLVSNIRNQGNLVDDVKAVLDTLIPKEIEVESNDQRKYLMRILPYRTTENVIEGVVLTFVDITEQEGRGIQVSRT
jgi:two-component system CheB/CheR fusion protein